MPKVLPKLRDKNCFVFDFDGTLVDSSGSHEYAFLEAMKLHAPDLSSDFSYEGFKGFRTDAVFRILGIEDEQLLSTLVKSKQSIYKNQVESGAVQLIPFALELLQFLKSGGRRIFLVTSASEASLTRALKSTNIGPFFECIVNGNDVVNAKPAPDCYLKCLQMSRISTQESIAIEDAASGIESAKAAGLEVIAVNNDALSGTDEYLGTLEQLYQMLLTNTEIN